MTPTDTTMTVDEQRADVGDIIADVALRAPGARAGRREPNYPLRSWLIDWMSTTGRERGQVLTPILRLPTPEPLLEILTSGGPYVGTPLGLTVTLRAVEPVEIVVGEEIRRITRRSVSGGSAVGGRPILRKHRRTLDAGEEITLPARWAIHALLRHCRSAHDPELQEVSAALPKSDALVEVGWSTTEQSPDGSPLTSAPRPRSRRKAD